MEMTRKVRIWMLMAMAAVMLCLVQPLEAKAKVTVSGGQKEVDYSYKGVYLEWTPEGENTWVEKEDREGAARALHILTDQTLTISGDNDDETGLLKSAIYIEKGVTANLIIDNLKMTASTESSCITLEAGSVLNLTIKGDCSFAPTNYTDTGLTRYYNSITVVPDATLHITDKSTGTLTASAFKSAVIGMPYGKEAGTIEIDGGHLILKGTGGSGIDASACPTIGSYNSFGPITIRGGLLELSTNTPGQTSAEFDIPTIGTLNTRTLETTGSLTIEGGTVVSKSNGHLVALGRNSKFSAKEDQVKVVYKGGNIAAALANTKAKNAEGVSVYPAVITLDGAADGQLLTSYEYMDTNGKHTVEIQNGQTCNGGKFYVWLPENSVVTRVSTGDDTYIGAAYVQAGKETTSTFNKQNAAGPIKIERMEYWPKSSNRAEALNADQVFISQTTNLNEGDLITVFCNPPAGKQLKGFKLLGDTDDIAEPTDTNDITILGKNCFTFQIPAGASHSPKLTLSYDSGESGDFVVTDETCSYSFQDHVLTLKGSGKATIQMKTPGGTTQDRIVFAQGANVDLTINGIQINAENDKPCIDVDDRAGDCSLILVGKNTLTSTSDTNITPAIQKGNGNSTLVICGDGQLNVYGNGIITSSSFKSGPGIGGPYVKGLTIAGGHINAEAEYRANNLDYQNQALGGFRTASWKITGGTIDAKGGGNYKGIQLGAISSAYGGTAPVITGGSLKVTDRTNDGTWDVPKNADGKPVYLTTIKLQDTVDENSTVKNTRITTCLLIPKVSPTARMRCIPIRKARSISGFRRERSPRRFGRTTPSIQAVLRRGLGKRKMAVLRIR